MARSLFYLAVGFPAFAGTRALSSHNLESSMPDVRPAMLTLAEAITYTGFCERTLRNRIREGRLDARKIGSRVRFMRADLDKFLGL